MWADIIFLDTRLRMNFFGTTFPLLDPTVAGGVTDDDKKALIAFLKTLNDEQYLADPKFSNPFPH